LAFAFSACEKDETQATLTPANIPTLAASRSSVVLTQANATQSAIVFTWDPISSFSWTNAEREYKPTVSYAVQIDRQGNNFAAPISIDAGAGPTKSLTVSELNASLNALGLTAGTAAPLEVRLRTTYAANSPLYSPTLALTATAYQVCVAPNSDVWGVVGPAADGWPGSPDPVTDAPMTYDCVTSTYKLTRNLNVGAFKFRLNRSWTTNYGAGPRDANGSAPIALNGPDIMVTVPGMYTITLNLTAQTYTLSQ
jgi:hypothetical protein